MSASTGVKNAIIKFLIAGTAGAYFTFLTTNLPVDLHSYVGWNAADGTYTLRIVVRYGYLFWFLAYFFTSNIPKVTDLVASDTWDIAFEMLQCVAGFTAAYFLGFLVPVNVYYSDTLTGVVWANSAIAAIAFSSLALLGWGKERAELNKKLNPVRWKALGLAVFAALFVRWLGPIATPCSLELALAFLAAMYWLLVVFGKRSLTKGAIECSKPSGSAAA